MPLKLNSRKNSTNIKFDSEDFLNRKTLAVLHKEISYHWSINNIDCTYQKTFLECLSKARITLSIQFLAKEIESLDKKSANIQQLYKNIEKREELIKEIKRLNEFLWEQKLVQEIKEKVIMRSKNRQGSYWRV
jgi:hypothetical protein